MAGDWIKMTHALPEKPEVLAIARKTGLGRFDVVGRLFVMWRWFDANTLNGNAPGVTLVTLNECLFGEGSATNFTHAVADVGWLEESEGGVAVPNFDSHISESAKTRAQTAKRVAKAKGKAKTGNAACVTSPLPSALPREDIEEEVNNIPPCTPPTKKPRQKSEAVTLTTWLADVKAKGERPVTDFEPLWSYVEKVKLPRDFIELAWLKFRERYERDEKGRRKRYVLWRAVFLKAVSENWFHLWFWSETDQGWRLTTVGIQADKATEVAA